MKCALRQRAWVYQRGEDSDATIAWDPIDFRSEEFGRSSIRIALADAIERLASEIDKEIRSFSSTKAEQGRQDPGSDRPQPETLIQPIPDETNQGNDSTTEAREAVADEGVQQLLAQAQERLNSVNASREKLEALTQALQGLTSAIEQKARLLEDGKVGETARVARRSELKHRTFSNPLTRYYLRSLMRDRRVMLLSSPAREVAGSTG